MLGVYKIPSSIFYYKLLENKHQISSIFTASVGTLTIWCLIHTLLSYRESIKQLSWIPDSCQVYLQMRRVYAHDYNQSVETWTSEAAWLITEVTFSPCPRWSQTLPPYSEDRYPTTNVIKLRLVQSYYLNICLGSLGWACDPSCSWS